MTTMMMMMMMMMKFWIVWMLLSRTTFADVQHDELLSLEIDEEDGTILTGFVSDPLQPYHGTPSAAWFAQQVLAKSSSSSSDGGSSSRPNLSEREALDIGTLLAKVAANPDSRVLIDRLKYGSGAADLAALKLEQSIGQIIEGLRQSMAQLKLLEALFDRDPVAALAEMERDGLVPAENLPTYRAQPELLEQDMRKAYYFSLVSLAVAGEFL